MVLTSNPATYPDEELIRLVAGGDRDAFLALYDRYAPRLLGLIHTVVRDRSAADAIKRQSPVMRVDYASTVAKVAGGEAGLRLLSPEAVCEVLEGVRLAAEEDESDGSALEEVQTVLSLVG